MTDARASRAVSHVHVGAEHRLRRARAHAADERLSETPSARLLTQEVDACARKSWRSKPKNDDCRAFRSGYCRGERPRRGSRDGTNSMRALDWLARQESAYRRRPNTASPRSCPMPGRVLRCACAIAATSSANDEPPSRDTLDRVVLPDELWSWIRRFARREKLVSGPRPRHTRARRRFAGGSRSP